jgi:hypothetical protein
MPIPAGAGSGPKSRRSDAARAFPPGTSTPSTAASSAAATLNAIDVRFLRAGGNTFPRLLVDPDFLALAAGPPVCPGP